MTNIRLVIKKKHETGLEQSRIFMTTGAAEDPFRELMGLGYGMEVHNFLHNMIGRFYGGIFSSDGKGNSVFAGKVQMDDVSVQIILDTAWLQYIQSLQVPDNFTVKEKMNWLANNAGTKDERPIWYNSNGQPVYGNCTVGHRPLRVYVNSNGDPRITYVKEFTWPGNSRKETYVPFVEIDGFKPYMKDMSRTWLLDEGYLQTWTALADVGKINYFPRGTIYTPVFHQSYFPHNQTAQAWRIPLMYLKYI